MKKNKILYILLAFILLSSSCTNYLDLKPYGKTIPETAEEFSAFLHTTLNNIDLGLEDNIINSASSITSYACYTDNLETSLMSGQAVLPIYVGTQINTLSQNFARLYSQIKDCNVVIVEMKDSDRSTDEGKTVLGTAYAMRAICYLKLVKLFCEPYEKDNAINQLGVPLVTEFDMEAKIRRSDLETTMNLIISDFNRAIECNVTNEEYMFTADVAKFYLARTYFWKGDWTNSAKYAKEVLDKYPLVSGDVYKEMIQSKLSKKGNVLLKSYIYSGSGDIANQSANTYINSNCPISKDFINLFTEKEKDIRYNFFFDSKRKTTKYVAFRLRSAEMCLTLAESYYQLKSNNEALVYLNMLRQNRISDYVPYTMENLPKLDESYLIKEDFNGEALTPLLYSIMTERQKEMFMEGDRWFELKRNGRPEFWSSRDGLKYITSEYLYTAPIPMQETDLVEGFKQNPGYIVTNN